MSPHGDPIMTASGAPASVAVARSVSRPERAGRWRRRVAYALLIGYALLMFIPFAWTVITSLKTLPDSVSLSIIPNPLTFDAYNYVAEHLTPSILVLFWNSMLIAGLVTLSNVVLGSIAGYAFARLRFRGREVLFLIVLGTLMIPDTLRLVPMYTAFSSLGLTSGIGQYIAVFVVLAISASSIFLMRQYFLTIPRDLEEAARIDGAGFFTTFWRVMLPLASPALAAVAVLSFQGSWNGFFWPVVFLTDKTHYTLPLGLTFFRLSGGFGVNWPPLMAVVVVATIPVVILYVFFQRYFVEGVAASGVKG